MGKLEDLKELMEGFKALKAEKADQQKEAPAAEVNPNGGRFKALAGSGGTKDMDREEIKLPEKWAAIDAKDPGVLFGRLLRANAASEKHYRGGGTEGAIKVIHDRYGDRDLAKWLEQSAEKDMSSRVASEGGYLIPERISSDVTDLLRPAVIVQRLGASELSMPEGVINIPRLSAGATATYVDEAESPNATSQTLGNVKFVAKKSIAIVPISNDLLLVPGIAADRMVSEDARKSLAVLLNNMAFNGVGANQPRGLLTETGLTSVTVGTTLASDHMTKFPKALLNANVDLDTASRLGWAFGVDVWESLMNLKYTNLDYIFRKEMMEKGTVLGKPFEVTQHITTNTTTQIYFGDWAQFIIARQGSLMIDSSAEAAYKDSGGTLVTAFGKDQTVIRVIDRHDMGMRQPAAMSRSTDVTP